MMPMFWREIRWLDVHSLDLWKQKRWFRQKTPSSSLSDTTLECWRFRSTRWAKESIMCANFKEGLNKCLLLNFLHMSFYLCHVRYARPLHIWSPQLLVASRPWMTSQTLRRDYQQPSWHHLQLLLRWPLRLSSLKNNPVKIFILNTDLVFQISPYLKISRCDQFKDLYSDFEVCKFNVTRILQHFFCAISLLKTK